jgi:hypothetical protein
LNALAFDQFIAFIERESQRGGSGEGGG